MLADTVDHFVDGSVAAERDDEFSSLSCRGGSKRLCVRGCA
jgi:hypothetical protein